MIPQLGFADTTATTANIYSKVNFVSKFLREVYLWKLMTIEKERTTLRDWNQSLLPDEFNDQD